MTQTRSEGAGRPDKPTILPSAPFEGLTDYREVAARLGVGPKTIKKWSRDPATGFPKLRSASSRKHFLDEAEVREWLRSQPDKGIGNDAEAS